MIDSEIRTDEYMEPEKDGVDLNFVQFIFQILLGMGK